MADNNETLLHSKPASARNSDSILSLQFSISFLIEVPMASLHAGHEPSRRFLYITRKPLPQNN
jgi:hypothetical protein